MSNTLDLNFLNAISNIRAGVPQRHVHGKRFDGVSPGSYWCDIDAVDYHTNSPGESASRIKHMLVSPARYQLMLKRRTIETDALRLGRMLHTTVLEPHLVDEEFAIWREGRRQGGGWDMFSLDNADKTIITEDQLACSIGMANALKQVDDFPLDAWLEGVESIEPAIKERSLFWVDEETGLLCKARPDAMTLGQSALAGDLKSARSVAREEDFLRDVFKFRYDVQAAHYTAGIRAVYGVDAKFAFFAVEKEVPHVTRTFVMTPEAIAHGERYRRYCLRMIKKCTDENAWPKQPPSRKPVAIEAPYGENRQLLDMAAAYGISV